MERLVRLFQLIRALNRNRPVSLPDLLKEWQVSKRTAYRDLRLLSKFGYISKVKGGYILNDLFSQSSFRQFTSSEKLLIVFALETHQLGYLFPFGQLALRLKEEPSTPTVMPKTLHKNKMSEMRRGQDNVGITNNSDIIHKFIEAVSQKCLVGLRTESENDTQTLIPLGVKLKSSEILLLFADLEASLSKSVPLVQISELKVLPETFSTRPLELFLTNSETD